MKTRRASLARLPGRLCVTCKPFFFGMPTLGIPNMLVIRLLASGDVEPNPGPQRRQQLSRLVRLALSRTSVCWSDDTDFSYSLGLMVQPCGGG